MMSEARKQKKIEREILQKIQTEKRGRDDRRSALWIYGVGIAVLIVLIATVTGAMVAGQKSKSRLVSAAAKPIVGVQSVVGFTRNHTTKRGLLPAYSANGW